MGTNKKEESKEQYGIDTIHYGFTENLESLGVFIINLSPIAEKYDKVIMQRTKETLEEALKIIDVSKNELKRKGKKKTSEFKLTEEQISKLVSVFEGLHHLAPFQIELLYKSSFVMLVSYFDFLISDLIHYFYQIHPENLSGKELSITLNELKLFDNLTEVINYVASKEVDRVLYGNLEDQRGYFKNYLKIDLGESIIHWDRINEAIERRNIIVHNNSKINRRYLRNVDLSVIPGKTKNLKEGKEIGIDRDYFTIVFDEILIAGIILTQSCWRKWRKDDIDGADSQLVEDMYDALLKEKWTVAERLGLFTKECKVSNERNRLFLEINYCQSLKWQNKKDELEKELEKFDTSTLSPIYILALSALKSDRDSFYKNVEKAIIVDKMEEADFMKWPLFRELRKDRDYEERVKAAFISVSQKKQK